MSSTSNANVAQALKYATLISNLDWNQATFKYTDYYANYSDPSDETSYQGIVTALSSSIVELLKPPRHY